MYLKLAVLIALAALGRSFAADFVPIPITVESLPFDVVVERGATPPPTPLTTATMDDGVANTGNTWYEQGFNPEAPETGLPLAGTALISESLPDHTYVMPPSYTNNNVFLIDSTFTNVLISLITPAAYSSLSFLTGAGHGPVTVDVILHHANGQFQTNSLVSPDWFGGADQALTANGRVTLPGRTFDSVNTGNPRLYSADLVLTDTINPVDRIDLRFTGTPANGHAAIFAVSGSTGGEFTPILVAGFNHDVVAEANAPQLPPTLGATTASMDAGIANTGTSWYEQGYNPAAPETGLPPAGSTFTNQIGADHSYTLPASYAANNAALVDAGNLTATLTLQTPAAYTGLSLLAASGSGSVTVDYSINHHTGLAQTGTVTVPDWFNSSPVAFTADGRVNVGSGFFDAVNSGNPRLYPVDIGIEDPNALVDSVTLNYASGDGHAVIMALSGASGGIRPIVNVQPPSTNVFAGATVEFAGTASGTAPLTFQWQRSTGGAFTNLVDSDLFQGATQSNLVITNLTVGDAGRYQLVVSNALGFAISQPVVLNVVSAVNDVTAPTDEITSVGGTSPASEQVANAIDDTTSKYLNFGTDGDQAAGFQGPVGLIVTPSVGSTVVTGLRIYTANDAAERDPVDFRLEGSTDGTNFTLIASGALTLPDTRNAAALALDPLTVANQQVLFRNTAGYTTYQLTFNSVKNNATANSMQIGEVEFLGTPGQGTPSIDLTVTRGPDNTLTITSSQPGTLQSSSALGDVSIWATVGPIEGSVTITPDEEAQFYRVIAPETP